MSKKLTGDKVLEYLDKFPNTPSLTLAKVIYKENKELYRDVEHVRSIVRHYRGANGHKSRESLLNRKHLKEFGSYNPFELPESDEREFKPFIIQGHKKLLVLNDVHIPYHSIEALNIMIEFVIKQGIDGILLNGDIIDFYHLSKFGKDPNLRDTKSELEKLSVFIDVLIDLFECPIYYKIGNHEERLEAFMKRKAPELFGIESFSLPALIDNDDITWINDKRTVIFGKLNILHGHELKHGIIAPVNVARGVFLRTKVPTMVGHWHIKTSHGENSLNEKYIECWSVGCLCELHPDYAPNNRWVHGFAIVDLLDDKGEFNVNNYKIIKGRVFE